MALVKTSRQDTVPLFKQLTSLWQIAHQLDKYSVKCILYVETGLYLALGAQWHGVNSSIWQVIEKLKQRWLNIYSIDLDSSPVPQLATHTQREKREVRLRDQYRLKLIFWHKHNFHACQPFLLPRPWKQQESGFPDLLISPCQWPPFGGSVGIVTPHRLRALLQWTSKIALFIVSPNHTLWVCYSMHTSSHSRATFIPVKF